MRSRKSLVTLICLLALLLSGGSALAQYPPPTPIPTPTPTPIPTATPTPTPTATPTPTPTPIPGPPFSPPPSPTQGPPFSPPPGQARPVQDCASVNFPDGENINGVVHVEFRGEFFVQGDGPRGGSPGCAPPGGDVVIWGQSHRIDFAAFQAQQDGSFRWPRAPDDAELPGHWAHCERHTIFVEVVGRGVAKQPVQILGPDGTMASCQLAGGTERGVSLPFTGAPLILLILWGIALIGIGTLLVLATYRRLRGETIRLPAMWRKPLALPPAEVPRLDTSAFRPLHDLEPATHRSRERPVQPLSERAERPAFLFAEEDHDRDRPTATERRAVPMSTILEAAERAEEPPPEPHEPSRMPQAREPAPEGREPSPAPEARMPWPDLEPERWDVDEFVFAPDRESVG